MAVRDASISELTPAFTFGFSGAVPFGLILHPSKPELIYPLGCSVVVENLKTRHKEFLCGHNNKIYSLALSPSSKFLASGQQTHVGLTADIIIWDLEKRSIRARLSMHKGVVQAIAFSPCETHLLSLGGVDHNTVILWSLELFEGLASAPGSPDSAGTTTNLRFVPRKERSDVPVFITGGEHTLRVWHDQKLQAPTDCRLASLKRSILCLQPDREGQYVFAGTGSGDILKVDIDTCLLKETGPKNDKDKFQMGVTCLSLAGSNLVVGGGDGSLALVDPGNLKVYKRIKVDGPVTSITHARPGDSIIYIGTSTCRVYEIILPPPLDAPLVMGSRVLTNAAKAKRLREQQEQAKVQPIEANLVISGHSSAINDICFPSESSELFATAGDNDVRIWRTNNAVELLKIPELGQACKCVVFNPSGSALISGWSDGVIRAYGPQSGRLQYRLQDAHVGGVTALAHTRTRNLLLSGGNSGQLRIWEFTSPSRQPKLKVSVKEHKGRIHCIRVRKNDCEAVTSSADGSCVIWDLATAKRVNVVYAQTVFKGVAWHKDEAQIITVGSDRKVAYWNKYDGELIRHLDTKTAVNGLDIFESGEHFAYVGDDKLLKICRYEEGDEVMVGKGHSTAILACKISPDQSTIITVGADASIFGWTLPRL